MPTTCIAFGAPRIFTKAGADEMNLLSGITYSNLHHGYEFPINLPPEALGFKHAGLLIQLNELWWHGIFCRISDHYYTNWTKSLIKIYKGDKETVDYLQKVVFPRCTI